jgi:hypothetical protein
VTEIGILRRGQSTQLNRISIANAPVALAPLEQINIPVTLELEDDCSIADKASTLQFSGPVHQGLRSAVMTSVYLIAVVVVSLGSILRFSR